jgi:hypothetical protein
MRAVVWDTITNALVGVKLCFPNIPLEVTWLDFKWPVPNKKAMIENFNRLDN